MLNQAPVGATLPVVDLDRARQFYEDVLGLEPQDIGDQGNVMYPCGQGSMLALYQRPTPTKADHTVASWMVGDVDAAVDELVARGVVFEQYDIPEMGLKTDARGVAMLGEGKGAWFKDTEGNILAIFQQP